MKQWFRIRWAWINSSRIIYAFYMDLLMQIFFVPFYWWLSSMCSDIGIRNIFCIGMPMMFFVMIFLLGLLIWHPLDEFFILGEIENCKECKGHGCFIVKCDKCEGKGYTETK